MQFSPSYVLSLRLKYSPQHPVFKFFSSYMFPLGTAVRYQTSHQQGSHNNMQSYIILLQSEAEHALVFRYRLIIPEIISTALELRDMYYFPHYYQFLAQ